MDLTNLLESFTDSIAGLVQYATPQGYDGNDETVGQLDQFCTDMKAAGSVDERIQVLGKLAPLNGTKISYHGFIEDLLTESSSRSWYW